MSSGDQTGRRSGAAPPAGRCSRPAPAPWEFAGLLVTYWCNARCAFCYLHSAPDRRAAMRPRDALALWAGLERLAAGQGRQMRVHLSGGEPFGDWPRLVAILRAARDAGLSPPAAIETNAFWATDDDRTRARLELLDALGIGKLVVSTDVYHQEFVPIDRARRCVATARRVLGRRRVRVRWWPFLRKPSQIRGWPAAQKRQAYRLALRRRRERLTGRAAERLAGLLPGSAARRFAERNCAAALLGARHVHLDPYGNVFPGVCSGIILGNALEQGVEGVWRRVRRAAAANPVLEALVGGGSYELMRRATALGYRELSGGYADRCHLCAHVRQFLFARGRWPEFLGPPECYAPRAERRQATEAGPVALNPGAG